MPEITLRHFERAAAEIGAHGDNDTLPFDIDTRFISAKQTALAHVAFAFFKELQNDSEKNSSNKLKALNIFSERLLAPTGATGFRIVTKIQPFWNIYFNGLGIAIGSAFENTRDERVYSYRFLLDDNKSELFDRSFSWRAFREATVMDAKDAGEQAIIVQTDISSFYEHISHHYVQNAINDIFVDNERIGNQVNALLSKFSGGRSFGLPIGGQCSRILAELLLSAVDQMMTVSRIRWHRYVDDYVLIAKSHSAEYVNQNETPGC
jgi:hypothetical protein